MEQARFELPKIEQGMKDLQKNRIYFFSKEDNSTKRIENAGGVYAFWIDGVYGTQLKNSSIVAHGVTSKKKSIKIEYKISKNLLKNATTTKNKICLYVGKTHKDMEKRLSQHLIRNSWRKLFLKKYLYKKPTTSCQLVYGLKQLFLNECRYSKQTFAELSEILSNVSISFAKLHGHPNAINRFYLEDIAIAKFFPLINIDIER